MAVSQHNIMTNLVTLEEIYAARDTIADKVHRTPLAYSTFFSNATGTNLYLKHELFQKTGSFKVRGVSNKMNALTEEEKRKGVITLSAGNHAQAVAWGAAQYDIPSTIIMPQHSVVSKQIATRDYGGEVILSDGNLLEDCLRIQKERDLYLVHPFDDPKIIAGHATCGVEIIEDVPNVDVVIVAVGGGGLISGVAAAVKQLKPDTIVYGVEPEGADGMTRSLAAGKPVSLAVDTIADGLAAPFVGQHNLNHVQAFVDQVVTVNDDEIRAALKLLWTRTKLFAEPAAAAPLAAMLNHKLDIPQGTTVVCIVCGGNVDLDNLDNLL